MEDTIIQLQYELISWQIADVELLVNAVLHYVKENQLPMGPALQFARIYQHVLVTFFNVRPNLIRRHEINFRPLVNRLVQLMELRGVMKPIFEMYVRPWMIDLLEPIKNGNSFAVLKMLQRTSKLQILKHLKDSAAAKLRVIRSSLIKLTCIKSVSKIIQSKIKGLTLHSKKMLRVKCRVKYRNKFITVIRSIKFQT